MASKNINAEKIQGNLSIDGITGSTISVNGNYDLPNVYGSGGDFLVIGDGSVSWDSEDNMTITGTTGGTIPFINSYDNGYDYSSGFHYDLSKLYIETDVNNGVVIDNLGGMTVNKDGGSMIFSGYTDHLSGSTVYSDNTLLMYATGSTQSVYGQDKQLYLDSTNPYIGINTNNPLSVLNVRGDGTTSGSALKINFSNSVTRTNLEVYNNQDTVNSGTTVTSNGVRVYYNNNTTYSYILPTREGNNGEILHRTNYLTNRLMSSTGHYNTYWIDTDLGNQYWITSGTSGSTFNTTRMSPVNNDVEQLMFNKTTSTDNDFIYTNGSWDKFYSYNVWANSYNTDYGGGTSTYIKGLRNMLVVGYSANFSIGQTVLDNTGSISNMLFVGSALDVNRTNYTTWYDWTNPIYTGRTNVNNLLFTSCQSVDVDGSQNLVVNGAGTGGTIWGLNNGAIMGAYNVSRQRKYQKPYINNSSYVLDVNNVIGFGGGKDDSASTLSMNNTINFGYINNVSLLGSSSYYANSNNYYGQSFIQQTEGIWFGPKWSNSLAGYAMVGMWLDPRLSGSTKSVMNFGFGSRDVFHATDQTISGGYYPRTGLNRPDSGAGVFYISRSYLKGSGGSYSNVPLSGVTNAVALVANEQDVDAGNATSPHPYRNTGLYINSDNNTGHFIGNKFLINPKKEFEWILGTNDSSAYQLSGSTAYLDVRGSGSTTTSTVVRLKNNSNNVGMEVVDNKVTPSMDIYFNGTPTSSTGLDPGMLYKNGSDQLSIKPGVNVCGYYDPPINDGGLALHLSYQTQTYDGSNNCISNGVLVQSVNGLSTSGNTSTQTNTSNQFTWNVQGGSNNYCYISGSGNKYMNITNPISFSKFFTLMMVIRINTTNSFRLFESSTSGDYLGEFNWNGTEFDVTSSGSTQSWNNNTIDSYTVGDWMLLTFYSNIESGGKGYPYIRVNGVTDGSSSGYVVSDLDDLDKMLIGGDIDVSEVLFWDIGYDQVYGGNTMLLEEQRLMDKYNIT